MNAKMGVQRTGARGKAGTSGARGKRFRFALPRSAWFTPLLTLILSCFVITDQIFAMCLPGFSVVPAQGTIKQNSLIVLMIYGWYGEEIVHALNKKDLFYLESEAHQVRLRVKNIYKGAQALIEVILEPVDKLIAGKNYQLKMDHFEGANEILIGWNPERNPIAWKVESTVDTNPPKFVYAPRFIGTRVRYYGCGPEAHAYFKMKVEDESEVLVQTELVDLESGKSTTFFLPYDNKGPLRVGRGMCGGAFSFDVDRRYKVRFRLMDISGNESDSWTDWVEFDSPYKLSRSNEKRKDHPVKH